MFTNADANSVVSAASIIWGVRDTPPIRDIREGELIGQSTYEFLEPAKNLFVGGSWTFLMMITYCNLKIQWNSIQYIEKFRTSGPG